MIVISGALVLIALVLLVLGLTMTDLNFVYGSIGVSLVSFVFLVIGILQRRGEPAQSSAPEVTEAAPSAEVQDDAAAAATGRGSAQFVPAATTAATTPARPAKTGGRGPAPVVEDDLDEDDLEPGGGPVLIVPGRPRYHVEGCRYLAGKPAEEVDVFDAQDDGFTACGVCKPDERLEELYGELVEDDEIFTADAVEVDEEPEDDAGPVEDTGVPGAGDDEPATPATAAGPRGGSTRLGAGPAEDGSTTAAGRTKAKAAKPTKATATKATATKATATKATATKATATKATARKATTGKATTKAPGTKPARATATKAAPVVAVPSTVVEPTAQTAPVTDAGADDAASTNRTKVVVIPDRDRFHTPACRFVRDALGTEELTRTQAGKQGYRACGVCRP